MTLTSTSSRGHSPKQWSRVNRITCQNGVSKVVFHSFLSILISILCYCVLAYFDFTIIYSFVILISEDPLLGKFVCIFECSLSNVDRYGSFSLSTNESVE